MKIFQKLFSTEYQKAAGDSVEVAQRPVTVHTPEILKRAGIRNGMSVEEIEEACARIYSIDDAK